MPNPTRSENSSAACLPEDLIHRIFSYLTSPADLAASSLLNKHWYRADGGYRRSIKVSNCFAVSPSRLTRRFRALRSLTLVGRPGLHDDKLTDAKWRVSADPWIESVSNSCGGLRELMLKRFVLSHPSMLLISTSFPQLRSLVLVGCVEITGFGLGSILRRCRFLEVLELRDCSGMSYQEPWLTHFPENCESLVSLRFANVKGIFDVAVLERLLSGCPSLKCLKFDEPLPPDVLTRFLKTAPHLVELGFGAYRFCMQDEKREFADAVMNCTSVESLSGAWCSRDFGMMSSLSSKLLFLDLTKTKQLPHFTRTSGGIIQQCHNLQRLWVLDSVGDKALVAVGRTCKKLHELKVIPARASDSFAALRANETVTDGGLAAVTFGCRMLRSVTYSCPRMSNAALITLAQQKPDFRRFELTLLKPEARYVDTSSSLDEGFGAILQSCTNLNRLSIRNAYVTDQVFFFAGMFGSRLKKLSVEFTGDSNGGLFYALNLCLNLKQLVIRANTFGDSTLLAAGGKLNNLQFVWVESKGVTVKGLKTLRKTFSTLSVDIIDQIDKTKDLELDREVHNLLIYHRLGEPHQDEP